MGNKDYLLSDQVGVTSDFDLEEFFLHAKEGVSVDVTIESDGRVVPLTMVERIKDKYGVLTHSSEYGNETTVLSVLSCDNLLYLAGIDPDDNWYNEDEDTPEVFFPIKSYSIKAESKKFEAKRIESLRDQDCSSVDSLAPVSRFGGWPVDSKGERLAEWPYFKDGYDEHPLIFQAQYKLPDGRMMWVFVNGVEALQTVHPMEKDPDWTAELHYVKGMSGKDLFAIHDRLYNRDIWHYENREFVGQKRPIQINFDNWKWVDNGIAVLVEGGPIPAWIRMMKALPEMLPFLTVSDKAASFPEGIPHSPYWVQCEPHEKNYDCRKFLFQIDDGAGGIDFKYGDMGSVYVYWNGTDAGVGLMQCY